MVRAFLGWYFLAITEMIPPTVRLYICMPFYKAGIIELNKLRSREYWVKNGGKQGAWSPENNRIQGACKIWLGSRDWRVLYHFYLLKYSIDKADRVIIMQEGVILCSYIEVINSEMNLLAPPGFYQPWTVCSTTSSLLKYAFNNASNTWSFKFRQRFWR